jgi:hypothetical protein
MKIAFQYVPMEGATVLKSMLGPFSHNKAASMNVTFCSDAYGDLLFKWGGHIFFIGIALRHLLPSEIIDTFIKNIFIE